MKKYIQISKTDGKEKEITKERALEIIKMNYRNPEYVLEESERLFGSKISCSFSTIEVK